LSILGRSKNGIAVVLRKLVDPKDVPYLLCGPDPHELPEESSQRRTVIAASTRHREFFQQMVETILAEKEEQERHRQRQMFKNN